MQMSGSSDLPKFTRLVEDLCQVLPKNDEGKVKSTQFLEIYCEKLRSNPIVIDELQHQIDDNLNKKAEMENKLKELQPTEQNCKYKHPKNQLPIMPNSVLTVHVIDGRSISNAGRMINPVLKISCDTYTQKTERLQKPTTEPIWDENFNFDIEDGREKLKLELYDGT